jgi:hypothetical protein
MSSTKSAGHHHGDQALGFRVRVDPAPAARPDMLRHQIAQPGVLHEGITGTSPACETRFGSSKSPGQKG